MHWLMSFFFLCVIGVSCTSDSIYFKDPNLTPEEEKKLKECHKIEGEIYFNFSKKMKEKHDLRAIGFGGGGDGKKVRMLSLSFNSYEKIGLREARKLLIECIQEFLEEINAHEDLSPCVCSWPFTYENVNIDILFGEKDRVGEFVQAPFIAVADIRNGLCVYKIETNDRLKRIKEETFEEALAALDKD